MRACVRALFFFILLIHMEYVTSALDDSLKNNISKISEFTDLKSVNLLIKIIRRAELVNGSLKFILVSCPSGLPASLYKSTIAVLLVFFKF